MSAPAQAEATSAQSPAGDVSTPELAQIASTWNANNTANPYRMFQQMSEHNWSVADVARATGQSEQSVGDYLTRIGAPPGFGGPQTLDRDALGQPYFQAIQNPNAQMVGWHVDPPTIDEDGVVTAHSHFDVAEYTQWYMSQSTPQAQDFARIYGSATSDGAGGMRFSNGAVMKAAYTDESGTTPASLTWAKDGRMAAYLSHARVSEEDREATSDQLRDPINEKLLEVFGGTEGLPENEQGEMMRARYGTELGTQLYRLDHATSAARNFYNDAMTQAVASGTGPGWKSVTVNQHDESGAVVVDESGNPITHTSKVFDEMAFHESFLARDDDKAQMVELMYAQKATRAENGELVLQGYYGQLRFQFAKDEDGATVAATLQSEVPPGLTKVELSAPPAMYDGSRVTFIMGVGFVTETANIKPPKKKKNWLKTIAMVVVVAAVAAFTAGALAGPVVGALNGVLGTSMVAASAGVTASLGGAIVTGALVGATTTMASGLIMNGKIDLKAVGKGMLTGALTAGLMNGLESAPILANANKAVQVGARMVAQGALSELSGGEFKTGALAGLGHGLGKAAEGLAKSLEWGANASKVLGTLVQAGVSSGGNVENMLKNGALAAGAQALGMGAQSVAEKLDIGTDLASTIGKAVQTGVASGGNAENMLRTGAVVFAQGALSQGAKDLAGTLGMGADVASAIGSAVGSGVKAAGGRGNSEAIMESMVTTFAQDYTTAKMEEWVPRQPSPNSPNVPTSPNYRNGSDMESDRVAELNGNGANGATLTLSGASSTAPAANQATPENEGGSGGTPAAAEEGTPADAPSAPSGSEEPAAPAQPSEGEGSQPAEPTWTLGQPRGFGLAPTFGPSTPRLGSGQFTVGSGMFGQTGLSLDPGVDLGAGLDWGHEPSAPTEPRTVRAGDYGGSLERVARRELGRGASQSDINRYVGQLFEINDISNARAIRPDQKLVLPDASTAAPTHGLRQYSADITLGEQIKAQHAAERQAQLQPPEPQPEPQPYGSDPIVQSGLVPSAIGMPMPGGFIPERLPSREVLASGKFSVDEGKAYQALLRDEISKDLDFIKNYANNPDAGPRDLSRALQNVSARNHDLDQVNREMRARLPMSEWTNAEWGSAAVSIPIRGTGGSGGANALGRVNSAESGAAGQAAVQARGTSTANFGRQIDRYGETTTRFEGRPIVEGGLPNTNGGVPPFSDNRGISRYSSNGITYGGVSNPTGSYSSRGMTYGVAGESGGASSNPEMLRWKLADQAGIPRYIDLSKPEGVWGLDGADLQTHFRLRGFDSALQAPKAGTSGKAQYFELESHPEIDAFQFHPGGGRAHGGSYYKFDLKDGSQVKIIDPATYNPRTIRSGTEFFNPQGQKIIFQNGKWIPKS